MPHFISDDLHFVKKYFNNCLYVMKVFFKRTGPISWLAAAIYVGLSPPGPDIGLANGGGAC